MIESQLWVQDAAIWKQHVRLDAMFDIEGGACTIWCCRRLSRCGNTVQDCCSQNVAILSIAEQLGSARHQHVKGTHLAIMPILEVKKKTCNWESLRTASSGGLLLAASTWSRTTAPSRFGAPLRKLDRRLQH